MSVNRAGAGFNLAPFSFALQALRLCGILIMVFYRYVPVKTDTMQAGEYHAKEERHDENGKRSEKR